MQVKEAIALAKQYVVDIFADERIIDVGLEEVELDDAFGIWSITIGFSRPWGATNPLAATLSPIRKREYKVVRIKDATKQMLSVKNRETVN